MRAVLTSYYEPDGGIMPRRGEIDMAGVSAVTYHLYRGLMRRPASFTKRAQPSLLNP